MDRSDLEKSGLIIIGHGSAMPHNREVLERLAEELRERSAFSTVATAFMERDRPTISEAIDSLAETGISRIVLVPAFLAMGVHTLRDIPRLIEAKEKELMQKGKQTEIFYGEPIGPDIRVAEIIEERALEALGFGGPGEGFALDPYSVAASRDILETSMRLIRREIGGYLKNVPPSHVPIIERVVHATADPEFAKLIVISEGAVEAGVSAIKSGAKVVADVKMVKAGISEARLKRFGTKVCTYTDDKRALRLANGGSITRSAAGIRLAVEEGLDGAVVLIGNAPTAAFEIAEAVKRGSARPALIVATPVGYVGAAKSKEEVSALPTPSITVKGRKGGSPVAASIFNALLAMAEREKGGLR
ncbi:MAG: precorrin-8X methylmutase [Candidatus Verstraetearchaeota archaeon]|nr:precorrin-8X methylmutase [Candidatus Verstraetearchaeota archaeon]